METPYLEGGDVGAFGGDVPGPVQEVLARNPNLVEHGEPGGCKGPRVTPVWSQPYPLCLLKPHRVKAKDSSQGAQISKDQENRSENKHRQTRNFINFFYPNK